MTKPIIRVLLVEDNPHDAQHIRGLLSMSTQARFEITQDGWLQSSLAKLRRSAFHMVILDLSLPDAHGLDAMIALSHEAPTTPVLVVTGADDVATAISATKLGASDYVVKNDLNAGSIERAIIIGVERKRSELVDAKLAAMSDDQVEGSNSIQAHTDSIARALMELDSRLRIHPSAHAAFVSLLDEYGLLTILHRINVRRSVIGQSRAAAATQIESLSRIVTSYTSDSYPSLPAVSVSDAQETFLRSIQALTSDTLVPHGAP